VWQREWLRGEVLEEQLEYWEEQLGGGDGVLELPSDQVRPAVQSYRGASEQVELGAELTRGLKELSRGAGATLYMSLLAGFEVLLQRYTGVREISVGTPVAGRSRREVEDLIGLFVNTVVVRNEVKGEESFRELLQRVRRVTLAGYAHEEVPFEKVVERLQPERSLSHSPLFQVVFAWQVSALPELQLSGVTARRRELRSETAKFELTLQLEESDGEVRGWLEYNRDLFAAESMRRLLGHYQRILQAVVEQPERRLAELEWLGESERRQLLAEWNQTRAGYPSDVCIHELFAAEAEAQADAVAVECGAVALSYGELNRRANQVGHHLRRLGVGADEVVGIWMERSVELVVGLLGILKAGGAYLPLEVGYPAKRLRYMLEDARARVVLTTTAVRQEVDEAALAGVGVQLVYLDADWERIGRESVGAVANCSRADNLAYLTYTSGSSGAPKGVSVVHRGVVRLVKQNHYARLARDEVFLHQAPLSFDASTFEIWGSLLNGARLVLMTAGVPSLEEIGTALRRYGVSTLWLTAGLFHVMVEERLADLRCLRQLLAGGDVLSPAQVERFLREAAGCTLINGYGPTENTTFSCTYEMKEATQFASAVPIGRPIANTEAYILDEQMEPAPVGVRGELYLGGAGLARGYQQQAELTAERFVPHPFAGEGGARLYRTGDVGRYGKTGEIEFLGRVDQQVKLRGYRIELGEIESVLRQHEEVAEAVVVVRGAGVEKGLVGYVVGKQQRELSVGSLRQYLSEQVPHYMVPGALVVLEQMPLTANGKVDRRALPAVAVRSEGGGATRALTAIEAEVAGVWEEVLGVTGVGLEDNFFELGGHSLLATRIVSRLREALAMDLSVQMLFESPTVEMLGRAIERHKKNGKQTQAPVLRAVSREQFRSQPPV
jgi:aspartate racemase